ncbi:hypothetical protein [Catenulispora sp. GP43]|uniref:hypothetical protein n=1 Tax=Catenulispora sp. GP43 TaxID=3156263 RepID=UPI003519368F
MASRLLAGLAIAASCVSCASSKGGAPPTVICGKTISRDPAGPVIEDATAHDITVTSVTAGAVIILRTASGCHTGADVAVEPSDAADMVDDVRGADQRYIAVVLEPHRDAFTVRVTRSPGSVSVVTVKGLSPATAMSHG